MTILGEKKAVYGTLAVVSADNWGSLALGGFKESCTVTKLSQQCMATRRVKKVCF